MSEGCENPDHAGTPRDYCRGCAASCQRELVAVTDRFMRILGDRREFEKRAVAAARRDAQDHVRAFIHLVLPGLLAESGDVAEVNRTIGRATMIDPEWGRTRHARAQLAALKQAGERALRLWHGRLAGVQNQFEADRAEREIRRLRKVITDRARELHDQMAPAPDGFTPCACPGCELIRTMDTDGVDLEAAS